MVKFLIIFISVTSFVIVDAASLWNKSNSAKRGLFAGKRAYQVGDLITIDVAESSSLAASQNSG
jgi:flagellar basal body L-ring protein FlgH